MNINSYHNMKNNASLHFYGTPKQMENAEPKLFMGFELEVEKMEGSFSKQETVNKVFDFENAVQFFQVETDGSLNNGFEIVSHPMTLEWCQSKAGKKVLDTLFDNLNKTEYGLRSHDTSTCGLHVHVSRDYMTPRQEDRFAFFIYSQKKLVQNIARRGFNNYNRTKEVGTKIHRQELDSHGNRYFTVNMENTKTIEIRAFKGTLNYRTFKATLEFVTAAVEFSKRANIYIISDKSKCLAHFLAFINGKKKYATICAFLKEHGYNFDGMPSGALFDENPEYDKLVNQNAGML